MGTGGDARARHADNVARFVAVPFVSLSFRFPAILICMYVRSSNLNQTTPLLRERGVRFRKLLISVIVSVVCSLSSTIAFFSTYHTRVHIVKYPGFKTPSPPPPRPPPLVEYYPREDNKLWKT